jgi:phenylacetate-CoA ligase
MSTSRGSAEWLHDLLQRPFVGDVLLRGIAASESLALRSQTLFRAGSRIDPELYDVIGARSALAAALHAAQVVPAYRSFLHDAGWSDDPDLDTLTRLRRFPVTDKASYINVYSPEERCVHGKIPLYGTAIDESSGSSGMPYNWMRGGRELRHMHRMMSQFARYLGVDKVITINGFSMGAWATGVNTGEALRANGVVKSTGPDIGKILHTMRFMGPRYHYVITGYPPFLKHVIDEGTAQGFPWSSYWITGIVGGEAISESLRSYLLRTFDNVFSGYGASDLEMGVGGETPFTVWVRQRAAADSALATSLFGTSDRLPMVFQYNPVDHFIELTDAGELLVTINRRSVLSPRIRYNVHDAGGIMSFNQVCKILGSHGYDPCEGSDRGLMTLPVLYLFGRSEGTLSYMGANVYPEDVEAALYDVEDLAPSLRGFCMDLVENENESRLYLHLELHSGDAELAQWEGRAEAIAASVREHLLAASADYRSAVCEDPSAGEIAVSVHAPHTGPFADQDGRIKRRYIRRMTQ